MKVIPFFLLLFPLFLEATSLREVALIADSSGFFPQTIVVFRGERLRLFMTTTEKAPKESCFHMQSQDIYLTLPANRIVMQEFLFTHAGSFPFSCPLMDKKAEGLFLVLDKLERTERQPVRPQSELSLKGTWSPRREE